MNPSKEIDVIMRLLKRVKEMFEANRSASRDMAADFSQEPPNPEDDATREKKRAIQSVSKAIKEVAIKVRGPSERPNGVTWVLYRKKGLH